MQKIKLTDLIDPNVMQKIQDAFSHYTGMAALMTDANGIPVTKGSGFSHFCDGITRKNPKSCENCNKCDRDGAILTRKNKKATAYTCHAGLCDFAAPIMLEGQMIGSFIGGQVRFEEVDEEKLTNIAVKYGIDPKMYVEAAKQTNCIPMENIQKAADFLEEIAAGLSGMAYNHYLALQESKRLEKAARSQSNFIMDMSTNMEKTLKEWFSKLENSIATVDNEENKKLLKEVHSEGQDVQTYIRDIIDYIRMSGQEVEINETKYKINDLITQIKLVASVLLSGSHQIEIKTQNLPEILFGDPGRIGQIVSKVIKILLNNDPSAKMSIAVKCEKVAYATLLHITICNKNTCLADNKIKELENSFENIIDLEANDNKSLDFSFVHLLLNQMSGNINFERKNNDLLVDISIPQLA